MSSLNCEIFLDSIKESLYEWTSLELAIKAGMGGANGQEKLEWMASVLFDYFNEFNDTTADEMAEYIDTIVDNEFETCIQDGSLEFLSSKLCFYRDQCSSGKQNTVKEIIDKKRIERLARIEQNQQLHEANKSTSSNQQSSTSNDEPVMEVEEGWTIVKKRRQ